MLIERHPGGPLDQGPCTLGIAVTERGGCLGQQVRGAVVGCEAEPLQRTAGHGLDAAEATVGHRGADARNRTLDLGIHQARS